MLIGMATWMRRLKAAWEWTGFMTELYCWHGDMR